MRHCVATRKFNRPANQRKALFRSLITALIAYERIETTLIKAKAIKGMAEKMVTLGKRGDLHAKRLAMAEVPNRKIMSKLFDDIGVRFADRNGGYLRIVKTRRRLKDQAELAVLEFVDYEERKKSAAPEKEKAKK
ncbi:MAG: 50S ribosomal protein L17 [Nitrospirae bacterium]|nr:50S ribosomal protein L17 [Nitrospirota bacterium]